MVSSDGLLKVISWVLISKVFKNSNCQSHASSITFCPRSNAFFIKSSGNSFPSHSIILIEPFFPATKRFNSDFSNCSRVGFTINSPSRYPICAAPTGPSNGIPAAIIESEAPIICITPSPNWWSNASGVIETTTSLIIPFGNIGLKALSVNLAYKIAVSEGLPSLLLYTAPAILPAAE